MGGLISDHDSPGHVSITLSRVSNEIPAERIGDASRWASSPSPLR